MRRGGGKRNIKGLGSGKNAKNKGGETRQTSAKIARVKRVTEITTRGWYARLGRGQLEVAEKHSDIDKNLERGGISRKIENGERCVRFDCRRGKSIPERGGASKGAEERDG